MCEEQPSQAEDAGLETSLAQPAKLAPSKLGASLHVDQKNRRLSKGSASTLLLLHVENITVYFLMEE